jgi:hypothetical protein
MDMGMARGRRQAIRRHQLTKTAFIIGPDAADPGKPYLVHSASCASRH